MPDLVRELHPGRKAEARFIRAGRMSGDTDCRSFSVSLETARWRDLDSGGKWGYREPPRTTWGRTSGAFHSWLRGRLRQTGDARGFGPNERNPISTED